MLTLRPDPESNGGQPTGWTVVNDDVPVGRAWKSQYGEAYTLNINGASITESSIDAAIDRARRHFGLDQEDVRGQIRRLITATTASITEADAQGDRARSSALYGLLLTLEASVRAAEAVARLEPMKVPAT
jgi:hypothetical protein